MSFGGAGAVRALTSFRDLLPTGIERPKTPAPGFLLRIFRRIQVPAPLGDFVRRSVKVPVPTTSHQLPLQTREETASSQWR